jgi:hypothetical protein
MKAIRRALVALFFAVVSSAAVSASFSTDQSDLWWADPPNSENGWGIQFVQSGSTIFATIFVYAQNGTPTWYVATIAPPPGGQLVWSGDLFTTTGPWFGTVPYNPATFNFRKVGTLTWTPSTVTTGVLTYTVDGVQVTKNLTRQTLVAENISGSYYGGLVYNAGGCVPASNNGPATEFAAFTVTQSGANVTISESISTGGSCTYNGTYTQAGRFGAISNGTFSCSSGAAGNFSAFEIEVNISGLTGRFASNNQVCSNVQGRLGGLRSTPY